MGVWDWTWLFLGELAREVVAVAAMALRWVLAEDGRKGREEIGARLTMEPRSVGWVAGTWRSDDTWMIAGWGRGGVEGGGDDGDATTAAVGVTARGGGGGGDSAGSGGGEEDGDADGECGRDGDREEDGDAYDGAGATEEDVEGRGDRVDGEGMVAGRPGGCALTRSRVDEGGGGERGTCMERAKRFW